MTKVRVVALTVVGIAASMVITAAAVEWDNIDNWMPHMHRECMRLAIEGKPQEVWLPDKVNLNGRGGYVSCPGQ